jgi:hypothetical protein
MAGAPELQQRSGPVWADQFVDQFAQHLARFDVGVLYVAGAAPLPVRYRSQHLAVECLLPRWSDLAYALEERPIATLIIPGAGDAVCWLQYQGRARVGDVLGWDEFLRDDRLQLTTGYLRIVIQPKRLDLFDERRGWGARETLEL